MFFKNVANLKTAQEKKYFLENIEIINRFAEKTKELHNLNTIVLKNDDIYKQLEYMGIIKDEYEIDILKKILKKDYNRLMSSISIYTSNKNFFTDTIDKFSNKYRKSLQTKKTNKSPAIIDLFCGAGGFSYGFSRMGYNILMANDIDKDALRTYSFNHPEVNSSRIINGDIRLISQNIHKYVKSQVDIIIGGPPCQSFSSANQQRVIDDPRNVLYKYFAKCVNNLKPKFIIMENVKGMLKVANQVIEDFDKIGYMVKYRLYDATNFSVPQKRIRLIYIGINKEYARKQNLDVDIIMSDIENEIIKNRKFVLKDALDNIDSLVCPDKKNQTETDDESGSKISINRHKNNEYLNLINDSNICSFIYNHKARFQNETNLKIYSLLKQGEDSTAETIKDIMPYSIRSHIFKDKYFKLIENEPSRTITAHLKMDCHSHIHPTQIRAITPREAARIQSFPDDYLFFGPYLKTYMQIGNAVPPLMSKVFAKVFKKYL
ncbi:two-component sensor [Campylobacter lari]|uniref:DNA cytosine methyltransferase n=1 Tax=Campylobacter lari TaxID=201 RepID=UPI000F6BDDCE|nr:DNA cytosine methyltransferase [Campylobacter lari]VEJ08122.1 two-component sensor [Campylobacter lari]